MDCDQMMTIFQFSPPCSPLFSSVFQCLDTVCQKKSPTEDMTLSNKLFIPNLYIYTRRALKVTWLKLYLLKQKWTMNEMLTFFKTVLLSFNKCPPSPQILFLGYIFRLQGSRCSEYEGFCSYSWKIAVNILHVTQFTMHKITAQDFEETSYSSTELGLMSIIVVAFAQSCFSYSKSIQTANKN